MGSFHSKFYDHSYSKDSVTLLQKNGPGEATSALTRKNKSTSELSGRNKSPSECNGMHNNTSRLAKRLIQGGRPLGTQDKEGKNSSEGKSRHSLERLGGGSQLLATPQGGVPLTCSDTKVRCAAVCVCVVCDVQMCSFRFRLLNRATLLICNTSIVGISEFNYNL